MNQGDRAIVCVECGHHNTDHAAFCASCGGYLEWTDREPARPNGSEQASGAGPSADPPDEPAHVPPGEPHRRRAIAVPLPQPHQPPAEIYCRRCGQGNQLAGNFCRRCGSPLDEAASPAAVTSPRLPWWRRVLRRGAVPPNRPPRRRSVGRLLRWTALLGALTLVVAVVGPWRTTITRQVAGFVNRHFPRVEPVRPVTAAASSQQPDHPAAAALLDLDPDTWWSERAPGTGAGETITAGFDRPVDLTAIGFYSGASTKRQAYLNEPRPSRVRVSFSGGGHTDLRLADQPGQFQKFSIKATRVRSVTIQILAVYPAVRGGRQACSIADIEFFAAHCRLCLGVR